MPSTEKSPAPFFPPGRIALAHDWLVGMRGGERVLDRLAALFGPTTLYTLVDDGCEMTDAIRACRVVTSSLQKWPGAAGRLRRWYLPMYRRAVEGIEVKPCGVLISSSSAVIKCIRPPAGVPHVCYCHSPARYIWEQSNEYARGSGGLLRSVGLRAVRRRFQEWDRAACSRVTSFVANSAHTAARIERCYGREAQVIHPPVRTTYFTPDPDVEREDWYLIVSALEPYKRTDLAVEAANRTRRRLKVIGDGSQRRRLEAMAGPAVELLGRVDDDTVRDHYRRAKALLFPQVEDFGIVAAEAQACGCPVVTTNRGGGAEIVTGGTGVRAAVATADDLIDAVDRLERLIKAEEVTSEACVANAARFSEERFDEEIVKVVHAASV